METRACSRCSRPADFSLALLLSTIRVRPRVQKCSRTIALCHSCLKDIVASLASSPLSDLRQPLISAYTAIADRSTAVLNPEKRDPDTAGVQDGEAAASSRPCLTAGNSRHHDDVGPFVGKNPGGGDDR